MFVYHMKEFRFRLWYFVVSFILCSVLIWEFKYSLLFVLCPIDLMFTELYEAFSCFLWLSLCGSFLFNLPFMVYSGFHFVNSGLFNSESKKYILLSKLFCVLFLCLLIVYMLFLLPFLVDFFIGFSSENLICSIKLLDFICFLELIIVMSLFTLLLGVISLFLSLENSRKLLYIGLLFVVALLTPPDVFSLLFVSLPCIIFMELLYFVSLINNMSSGL
jgi:sec-independent protein translocase protein TatC